ncbi:hypothetical protein E5F05_15325 [Deinococcus metallilatus]|uniref:Uncharacterized protein n=1 Tax=Deinococcus metallilatus TaxID=1211322 RepID=A0AAJ5JXU3_9DEIO|nr:hypothetical protein [Deinococcus metallilatus]MBB5296719.1 hypothetical protein [Deinococcus metallilatus]QBY09203.1 hypothetical protein E5F05_15325 [Deinococcus metallilatus]RXJ09720.1 hypothetical protein ERJ73_14155 [Deinococcus metallilatus]TLK24186.1 hypothetical protein FCS05_15115 [Deinococcus metallilatus]GMA13750.1 hypothetical protein GCM10025871_00810 [Deinococcus metallilatus]
MTDSDHRYGDAPLGKSVEEIEQDSGNLVNSPVEGEEVRDGGGPDGLLVPPILSGPSGTGMIPAIIDGGRVIREAEDGSGADDGTDHPGRDSSEGTV